MVAVLFCLNKKRDAFAYISACRNEAAAGSPSYATYVTKVIAKRPQSTIGIHSSDGDLCRDTM